MFAGIDVYFTGTKEFLTYKNIFMRIAYGFFAMTSQKMMYYIPWCMIDASSRACGLSYNGTDKDGNYKWDRVVAVDILTVETSASCI